MTEDGTVVPVEDLCDTGEWQPVYNIRIADFHTYFVGCGEWGWAAWAHNLGCEDMHGIMERRGVLSANQRARLAADPEFVRLYQGLADVHGPHVALRVIAGHLNDGINFSKGTFVKMTFRRSEFTVAEQNLFEFKYAIANRRIATGAEIAEAGANIPYRSHLSRRFERATVQPETKAGKVRISDGYQIDEFVPTHSNGPQSPSNQSHTPNENNLNNRIGPMEVNAARQQGMKPGQRFNGWQVEWVD